MALSFPYLDTEVLPAMIFQKKWNPSGQHCFVTGGSSGLGLALAVLLTEKGAHVSIVARNQEKLDSALKELEVARQTPQQVLKAYSFDVGDASQAAASLEAACEPHDGRCPTAVFLCAGAGRPGFFVEQDEESLRRGMDEGYWVQAWSALAAAKRMVREQCRGRIVFVSSFLGYMSIVGYSSYSPGKFALRGLAEALHSELMLYGIDVHICFPGAIYTPGYTEENKTKPNITLKIEAADPGSSPEGVAKGLLKGVEKGYFHITYDFLGDVFRSSTRGSSPGNNFVMDAVYALIGYVALPIGRSSVDTTVRAHAREHRDHLQANGFFDTDAHTSA